MLVTCPHCRAQLDLPDGLDVPQVQCAVCGNHIDVPALQATRQPAATPQYDASQAAAAQAQAAASKRKKILLLSSIAAAVVLAAIAVAVFVTVFLPDMRFN